MSVHMNTHTCKAELQSLKALEPYISLGYVGLQLSE